MSGLRLKQLFGITMTILLVVTCYISNSPACRVYLHQHFILMVWLICKLVLQLAMGRAAIHHLMSDQFRVDDLHLLMVAHPTQESLSPSR